MKNIELKGVKQNNLKNIDVSIPIGSFTVICGPSGSGKSSLAFQTLFAEGQRRYIESLSNYSKQFINKAPKPDLLSVENIPPAIALQQKNGVRNSRSTVGTSTEITDYLRLLFSKVGQTFCPDHNIRLKTVSPIDAAEDVIKAFPQSRAYILFPIYQKLVAYKDKELLKHLIQLGFLRGAAFDQETWQKGTSFYKTSEIDVFDLNTSEALDYIKEDFFIVVDRLVIEEDDLGRIFDSFQQAYDAYLSCHSTELHGEAFVWTTDNILQRYTEQNACPICDFKFPPLSPQLFSFNSALGACESCSGFGNRLEVDEHKVIPFPQKTLMEGAIAPFAMPSGRADFRKLIKFCEAEGIDVHTPWVKMKPLDKQKVWEGHKKWFGVLGLFEYLETKKYKMHVRVFLARYKSSFTCKTCHGSRLKTEVDDITVQGKNITQYCNMPLSELLDAFYNFKWSEHDQILCKEVLGQLKLRLEYLNKVGLGYLTLDRLTRTLSGGEYQRMNLAHQLGMGLSQTLFILDEPTIGLHSRDNDRLIEILKGLHELGNTVVVVEHDHDVIQNSERVIELGPGSGHKGGEIIYSGETKNFLASNSLTAHYLKTLQSWTPPREVRPVSRKDSFITLEGAVGNNLKNVTLQIPLKKLITVTGVSGSGKSSLITGTLYPALAQKLNISAEPPLPFKKLVGEHLLRNVFLMDQNAVGKTQRSNPATYLKIYDVIRSLYADTKESKFQGFTAGTFSLNVDGGRCPTCKGLGHELVDMIFMDDILIPCEDCKGKRFRQEVLKVKFNNKNIHEVLEMTAEEALKFFVAYQGIRKPLSILKEVGLEHLKLGQALSTLSGGEIQRLKLAKQFLTSEAHNALYILDEPTTGLHFREIELLLKLLQKLVEGGATVLLIEHNLEIIKNSDWVIDIGPEAGSGGGKIIAEGTPVDIAKKKTYTARYLKQYLSGEPLYGSKENQAPSLT
ncbi:MAG: excinuclease ABC subunit UvrA [Bdellovibrionaceae bacterium]|nr:excinuclease ABC subunit UvrA [Pseudobdellovibrionaceae bacterium]